MRLGRKGDEEEERKAEVGEGGGRPFLSITVFSLLHEPRVATMSLSRPISESFSPMLSSSFIVLGLTTKTLIYFELIFADIIREGSNFILLHVNI